MCGRYVSPDQAAIERAWHIGRHNNLPFVRRFNVAPGAVVPVLRFDRATGGLVLDTARWGLIPHWWKDARPPGSSFNARLEEAAAKPLWRDALRRSRCLVPAEGWYEWRSLPQPAPARDRRAKQPYFICRGDHRLIAFAGIFSRWSDPASGTAVTSCAILTRAATGALIAIHDRMPVVAPEPLQPAWLDAATDGVQATRLLEDASFDTLEHNAVGTRVNDAHAEGPELVEPLAASAG